MHFFTNRELSLSRINRIKVLIADDMVELRSNVKRMLANHDSIRVIGEAGDGRETIDKAKELSPHVVLMDINMPELDGLKASEILTKEFPNVQIVIMSIQSEQEYFRRAMKAGAKDFLTKPFSTSDLVDTITSVFNKWLKDRPDLLMEEPKADVITFFSTKGGVGKTTLAANLAVHLASRGKRTLLIDASLQSGDIGITLNQKSSRTLQNLIAEGEITADLVEEHFITHSSGLQLLLAPSEPAFAEAVKPEHFAQIIELAGSMFQYIIFDSSPHISSIELSILDNTDYLFLVATLEITSLKNTRLCLKTLADIRFDKEKIKLILNKDIQNVGIDAKDIEAGLAIPVFSVVPMDSETAQRALNAGDPFVTRFADSQLAKAVEGMSFKVAPDSVKPSTEKKSMISRVRDLIFGSQ